ncbi:MAG: hypothetical protein HQL90_15770 [Magnetococcales bacterium]|nr:hypothetical protein [Magnetococcales bacterium]
MIKAHAGGSPSRRPDEMRLSRLWCNWLDILALFSVASAGREAIESLVVRAGVVLRRIGRTRGD